MQVRVLASGREAVRFEADGREHALAPVVADNVSIAALPEGQAIKVAADRMSALSPGQQGTVVGISAGCRGAERRRLMDLGLIPGTVVTAELQGPGGDPTGYRIRGAVIALRRQQADWIQIRRPDENEAAGGAAA
jgi:DtxR family Mn-dependent transcriptional regulator